MFQLVSLFACGSSPVAPVAAPERWDVVGTLPDEIDLSALSDLPPGSIAVVGDPRTGEVAVVTREGESSRSVGSDFHVVSGAQCLDCGDPTCASSTRTLELLLEQDAGNDGEDLTVVRTGGSNFSGVVHTPASFTSQVGQQVTIQSTGTLPTCAPFAYYFDVTGPDCDPWYEDADGDGFGAGAATIFCAAPGTGWSLRGDDCDDTAASAFPGGVETCNGIDDDCSGSIDDGGVQGGYTDSRDLSATLMSGTAGSPAMVALTDETLTLCPGTYHVQLASHGIVDVIGNGATLAPGTGSAVTVTGGAAFSASDLVLRDGTGSGGGVSCDGSTVSLTDVELTGHDGLGAISATTCDVDLTRCNVHHNTSPGSGGGLRVESGTLDLVDTLITDNTAVTYGGGFELVGSAATCTGSTLHRNVAAHGGHLHLHLSSFDMDGCDLGLPSTPEDGVPDDIVTYGGDVERRYVNENEQVFDTCRSDGICGARTVIGSGSTFEAVAVDEPFTPVPFFTNYKKSVSFDLCGGAGRFDAVATSLRLTNAGDSCIATLSVVAGSVVSESPAATLGLAGTAVSNLDADILWPNDAACVSYAANIVCDQNTSVEMWVDATGDIEHAITRL